jgi:hypothetical protein
LFLFFSSLQKINYFKDSLIKNFFYYYYFFFKIINFTLRFFLLLFLFLKMQFSDGRIVDTFDFSKLDSDLRDNGLQVFSRLNNYIKSVGIIRLTSGDFRVMEVKAQDGDPWNCFVQVGQVRFYFRDIPHEIMMYISHLVTETRRFLLFKNGLPQDTPIHVAFHFNLDKPSKVLYKIPAKEQNQN